MKRAQNSIEPSQKYADFGLPLFFILPKLKKYVLVHKLVVLIFGGVFLTSKTTVKDPQVASLMFTLVTRMKNRESPL